MYIRYFVYKYQEFKNICKTHGAKIKKFSLDTDHHWNITYLMQQSTQKF